MLGQPYNKCKMHVSWNHKPDESLLHYVDFLYRTSLCMCILLMLEIYSKIE